MPRQQTRQQTPPQTLRQINRAPLQGERPVSTPRVAPTPAPNRVYAVVRLRVPGFHNWPGATGERAYLAQRHRHLFHVEVRLQVWHDEREVEYHDLLDVVRAAFPGGEMGARSCETMARRLYTTVARRFPGRQLQVGIFEDGEVGAILRAG